MKGASVQVTARAFLFFNSSFSIFFTFSIIQFSKVWLFHKN